MDPQQILQFPHAAAPAAGLGLEIVTGLRWLGMPLPFALDHILSSVMHGFERAGTSRERGWDADRSRPDTFTPLQANRFSGAAR